MDDMKLLIKPKTEPLKFVATNSTRYSFVINYILTLFVTALLLAISLAPPSSAQNSVPFSAGGSHAHRVLVASDVSTAGPKTSQQQEEGQPIVSVSSDEPKQVSQSLASTIHGSDRPKEVEELIATQEPASLSPRDETLPASRQTRATTRKHSTTVSGVTDRELLSTSSPSTSSVGDVTSPLSTTLTEDVDDLLDRALKERRKRKKMHDEEDHTEAAEEETEEESDHSTDGQHYGHLSRNSIGSSSTTPMSSTEFVPSSTDAFTTTTSPKKTTRRRKITNSTSIEPSLASSTKKVQINHDHEHNKIKDEHRMNMTNIKTVGLDKWNETLASTDFNKQSDITTPTLPKVSNSHQAANTDNSTSTGDATLDARSPSAQAPSLSKRLTGLIAESKNKLLRHQQNRSTTAESRFAYSKPSSASTSLVVTTPMPTTLAPTDSSTEPMYVQIVNHTDVTKTISSNDTSNLDWSKLVKVVFKSSKDNRTMYTVVMNSSELNSHPISDWSNELPKLLQRDFEKLIQKWSNVFPVDHLITDLGKIIKSKASNSSQLPVVRNLDGTLAQITFPISDGSSILDATTQSMVLKNSSFQPNVSHRMKNVHHLTADSINANSNHSSNLLLEQNKGNNPTLPANEQILNTTQNSANQSNQVQWSSRLKASLLNSTSDRTYDVKPTFTATPVQVNNSTDGLVQNTGQAVSNKTTGPFQVRSRTNRTVDELFQDLTEEHEIMDKGVKDQSSALKNFIVISLTTLVVVLTLIIYAIVRLRS